MFHSERDFSLLRTGFADTQAAEQSMEQRQRDVFESHRHRTFSLAFYMTGNELEAEEILAQTFIRAFQRSERPNAAEVDASLIVEFRERFSLEPELPCASTTAEHAVGRNVRRPELEAALLDLPPNERLLFLLRDVEGYPPETIAALLGVPQPEVHRLLLSARLRLCQKLAALARSTAEAA